MRHDPHLLRDINVSIVGGLVAGITVFTYQYLLDKGWNLLVVFLVTLAVFFAMYLPIRKDSIRLQKQRTKS